MVSANDALFAGRLDEAADLVPAGAPSQPSTIRRSNCLPRALVCWRWATPTTPSTEDEADALLADVGEAATPYAAYAWFCAGEAVLSIDVDLARARFARAVELAEATNAAIVAGIAGASKASIDARVGDAQAAADDYRRLINHWRRAGMWSTQWTMLRSIAGLLARLERPREAAVLLGAVTVDAGGASHLRRRRDPAGRARPAPAAGARRAHLRGGARRGRHARWRRRRRAGARARCDASARCRAPRRAPSGRAGRRPDWRRRGA